MTPWSTSEISSVGFAFFGVAFFIVYLMQVVGIRLKRRIALNPRVFGLVLILMFILQLVHTVLRHNELRWWAYAIALIGSTFGLAAGITISWYSRVSEVQEA